MENKIALVAGGGSGIGRETARLLANRGARVLIVDLNASAAEVTAGEIRDGGGEATAFSADCSILSELEILVRSVREVTGAIDVLFCNVGMPNPHGIVGITEDEWQTSIDVNLKSGFFLTQLALPLLRATGRGGSIIYTASAAGLIGSHTSPLYSLTKAGIIGLVRSLAIQLAVERIRVNAVCPGAVRTPMLARFMNRESEETDEVARLYSNAVPMGRVAEAREIAEAVAFLASDESAYITGVALPVDGGLVVALPLPRL